MGTAPNTAPEPLAGYRTYLALLPLAVPVFCHVTAKFLDPGQAKIALEFLSSPDAFAFFVSICAPAAAYFRALAKRALAAVDAPK